MYAKEAIKAIELDSFADVQVYAGQKCNLKLDTKKFHETLVENKDIV